MAEAFIGEIRLAGFNYAPTGWLLCQGQLLSIATNTALFSVLGTAFGGNGTTTFALPDLRGRAPVHVSASLPLGVPFGSESVALTASQIAGHSSPNVAAAQASAAIPGSSVVLGSGVAPAFATPPGNTALAAGSVSSVGGNQPHPNMQPSLVLNYIICTSGTFPT